MFTKARGRGRGLITLLLGLSFLIPRAFAEEITVAVATNFAEPLAALRTLFEQQSGHRLVLSTGSSGQLYAQIVNGAPYQVFLSADDERPRRLEAAGRAVAHSRFTYAVGRLALWQRAAAEAPDARRLHAGDFRHLALANPRLAPYGLAARQTLERLGLWQDLADRIVLGENIGQTYALAATGNAELALVALAQLQRPGAPAPGAFWEVPAGLHDPILQQAILVKDGAAARAFLDFLRGAQAREIIQTHGYDLESQTHGYEVESQTPGYEVEPQTPGYDVESRDHGDFESRDHGAE